MCTVTFIPAKDGVYLSSNRDEQYTREGAVFPAHYQERQFKILYPKDREAGGSWIALRDNGEAAVLLNGAFHRHELQPSYRKSRGLVFLDLIKSGDLPTGFEQADLDGIQPFTLVAFSGGQLFEYRWDGHKKYRQTLDPSSPHIWASATLYDKAALDNRKEWLQKWYASQRRIDTAGILDFHRYGGTADKVNGLVIDRDGRMGTVSITSVKVSASAASMTYLDLKAGKQYNEELALRKNTSSDGVLKIKRKLIRLFNWEYWPMSAVYAAVVPYWVWNSLKAKTFFWFSASNATIFNAGFLLESKKQIYDLIPPQYYPATLFFRAGESMDTIRPLLEKSSLVFPLIAKPDIGQRGVQVKLLRDEADLREYAGMTKVNFLLQEYIDYEYEVGIFYYRIPGQLKGHISGIVGKELLAITGDGQSTMEELLLKEDRFLLQLPALRISYGKTLGDILPAGLSRTLVPYGNHSRGAKFVDWSSRISPELERMMDELCQQIPGFDFGRMDIKFKNWTDLCAGRHFSVIELNGAGSEPTHMYDPAHSIFFAWKEIIRHWRILYRICRLNADQKGIPFMSTRQGLKMLRENAEYLKLM